MPNRPPRPQCRICARKMALDTTGQCYDCKAKPPKFRIGDLLNWLAWCAPTRPLTVASVHFSLDYGWFYRVLERVSWKVYEDETEEVK